MRTSQPRRRGTIVPLMALCVTGLFGFVALAVDLGILAVTRTQCQNAADAAALAGARQLNNSTAAVNNNSAAADTQARTTVTANRQLNAPFTASNISAVDIGTYTYDTTTQRFVTNFSGTKAATDSWTAVRVSLTADQPMFFAKILGIQSMPTGASAVAVHRPRDIALILDFSGSMYFGSIPHWETGYTGSSGVCRGLMNPDDNWPKFGHYGRYEEYSPSVPIDTAADVTTVTNAASPAGRANPLQRTAKYTMTSGDVIAPNNHSVESNSGPPMMFDFRFNPANIANPGTAAPATANMWNAFHRWFQATPTDTPDAGLNVVDRGNPYKYASFQPAVSSTVDNATWVKRTYDWTGYNPLDTTNTKGPTPAPDFFDRQADDGTSGVAYAGDRFPRKGGVIRTASTSWAQANADGAAVNPIDFLGWRSGFADQAPRRVGTSSGSGSTFRPGLNLSPNTADYNSDWRDFRDATWERYGYDLDVADYVANRGATWDPRWDWNIDTGAWQHARPVGFAPTNAFRPKRVAAAARFQGYSMGPGYWGKTFAVYPPDPRWGNPAGGNPITNSVDPHRIHPTQQTQDQNGNWICDWRKRFFLTSTGATFTTENVNAVLFQTGANAMLRTNGYRINYAAVLAWLKSGPQTLPPNLRSGRILYYARIPDDATSTTDLDECFWRGYINFVLGFDNGSSGFDCDPQLNLAGVEYRAWPEGAGIAAGRTTSTYTHGLAAVTPAADPAPYLNYSDNPSRPRAHLWFGPQTLLMYLYARNPRNSFMSGTAREAQCWQLKAAVNSALEDIRVNHPNDWCGMGYFANFNFSTPRVSIGQDWARLKNSLFYPNSLLTGSSPLINNVTSELRPYNTSLGHTLVGNLPNSNGGTDPNTGMALGYNLLSGSTSLSSTQYPTKARRGASKIVIFETDGVPNGTPGWSLAGTGYNTFYQNSGSTPLWSGETRNGVTLDSTFTFNANACNAALSIVKQVCTLESSTGQGGHSTANAPARVYPIGFGDLFSGYDGTYGSLATTQAQDAVKFLTRVAQLGNTGTWDASYVLPTTSVITGNYTDRINNLRTSLERIMQSGVQVTLIQ